MIVLIDPGHGIDTAGKRSPNGAFREYLWNRQVADMLCDELTARGVRASVLVTETNDIPLSTRVQRVNKVCAHEGTANVLLVSVHANAAGNGDKWMNAKGWSCYTSKGQTAADKLATAMYDAFRVAFPERTFRTDYTDGDVDMEADFYILRETLCPAVLLENFFYDNEEECQFLMCESTKERVANAAADGICKYLAI